MAPAGIRCKPCDRNTPVEDGAPNRISGRYAARLSSRCALLGANAALRAAKFELGAAHKQQRARPEGLTLLYLARPTGFEPVTPAFGVRAST